MLVDLFSLAPHNVSMARQSSISDCIPTPITSEISDVVMMSIAPQASDLNDAMRRLQKDLLNLNEALVTKMRYQSKVLENVCKRTSNVFLEVKYILNEIFGEAA